MRLRTLLAISATGAIAGYIGLWVVGYREVRKEQEDQISAYAQAGVAEIEEWLLTR